MFNYVLSFFSGIATFFSPCILPLIPGYLALISGFSASQILKSGKTERKNLLLFSLSFIIGFSLIFSMLGLFSTFIGSFLMKNKHVFEKVSGIIVFILGLHISGLIEISFLKNEKRKILRFSRHGYIEAFLTGISFAFGWTPCIGPFLASILTISASKSAIEGMLLLLLYSFGIGVGFIVATLFSEYFFNYVKEKRMLFVYISRVAGIILAIVGILIFFNKLAL